MLSVAAPTCIAARMASPVLFGCEPLQRGSCERGRYWRRISALRSKPPAASTTPRRAWMRMRRPSRSMTAPVTRPSVRMSSMQRGVQPQLRAEPVGRELQPPEQRIAQGEAPVAPRVQALREVEEVVAEDAQCHLPPAGNAEQQRAGLLQRPAHPAEELHGRVRRAQPRKIIAEVARVQRQRLQRAPAGLAAGHLRVVVGVGVRAHLHERVGLEPGHHLAPGAHEGPDARVRDVGIGERADVLEGFLRGVGVTGAQGLLRWPGSR